MAVSPKLINANEAERLAALRRYDILDTPPDRAFDRLTAMAVRLFKVPISIVSIVDSDRIWFKSYVGLDASEIGRDPGLCASAILQDDVWLIVDAKTDPCVLANPLVASDFGLRFYAGAPLKTADGFHLGTICIIDKQPRQLSDEEKLTLQDLAAIVMSELELRLAARKTVQSERMARLQAVEALSQAERLANTDILTGLSNRRAFDSELRRQLNLINQQDGDAALAMIDLNGLKAINDNHGHDMGDTLLRQFAVALQANLRQGDSAYRFGGDEFALILPGARIVDMPKLKQRLDCVTEQVQAHGFSSISASVGIATLRETGNTPYKTVQLADARMYSEKMAYYSQGQKAQGKR